jgi:hypothetical protein
MTMSSDNDIISCNSDFLAGTGVIEATSITPDTVILWISELCSLYNFVFSVLILASLYPLFVVCVAVETDHILNVNIGCWSSSSK